MVPHRGHRQLERSQDLAHAPRAEPSLVLDLIREVHEGTLAMIIWQLHRISQIEIHRRGAVQVNLPHPVIPLLVHLPHNHPIGIARVSDTLAKLLCVFLGRCPRDVIVLLRITPNLLDRLGIALPPELPSHPLVRPHTHRHHMHRPICILQIHGVCRHNEIHRVNRLKPHPLITGIPEALDHPAPAHQRVIHPAQDFIRKIGLVPNLIIEPVLSHLRIRIQLLAHRNKAGHNIHAQRLLEEQRLELLDRRINERPMQIRGLGPGLIGTSQPVMA